LDGKATTVIGEDLGDVLTEQTLIPEKMPEQEPRFA
jgi:hypothetical protein